MNKTEVFIEKARLKHGDTYDYSKVEYISCDKKVIIICQKHNEFLQIPGSHLNGRGCKACGIEKRANINKSNTEVFVEKARLKHGDTYDYSKVEYKTCKDKVIIVCKIHGVFLQKPNNHLSGKGCDACGGTQTSNTNMFNKLALAKHGEKYDYSKVEYINNHTKVIIICKIHGVFLQKPNGHLDGKGCNKCGTETVASKRRSNTENFILKSTDKHGDIYDYSKVMYKRSNTKVIIICKKHGEFLQIPNSHLSGYGCPFCINKTEWKLYEKLQSVYPTITPQFKTEWCKNTTYLPYDFCIPELNIIIELDGGQHFKQVMNWQSPEVQFENDQYKEQCANDNNYSMIRLLQDDVWNDKYDWCKELCAAIEDIKRGDDIVNIYLCKNNEYDQF
jgi:very-short-patch-repair endonuclease